MKLSQGQTADNLRNEPIRAMLKWFNIPKGFGFVVPENETADAFLHVTTLKRAGIESLGEGACLICRIECNVRGLMVKEVVSVLDEGTLPEPIGSSDQVKKHCDTLQLTGTVKWYRPEKGFGFVAADDGGKDIFLHKNFLRRYGLESIEPRTPIMMTVSITPKGREVVDFEFLYE